MSKITVVSLIYKSPAYARGFHDALIRSTPEIATGEVDFFYVANNANKRTLRELERMRVKFYKFNRKELNLKEHEATGFAKPEYLSRVYAAYNYAIQKSSTDYVLLLNSDMVMAPGWFQAMKNHLNPDLLLSPSLVERNHPKFGVFPGATMHNFGFNFRSFKWSEWTEFCKNASLEKKPILLDGGPYMPSVVSRSRVLTVGGFPEGNIRGKSYLDVSEYGDEHLFNKLGSQGIKHQSITNVFCYHFKEGEMNSDLFSFYKSLIYPFLLRFLKNILRPTYKYLKLKNI